MREVFSIICTIGFFILIYYTIYVVSKSYQAIRQTIKEIKRHSNLFNFEDVGPWKNWRQSHPAKWSEVIQHLKTHEFHGWGALNMVYIPVTKDSFDFVDINKYQRYISEFHMNEINEFIKKGYIYTHDASLCNDNTIEVGYCLDRGDSSDDDGFGAETDVWLIAKLDLDGNYIEPFRLKFWRYIR